MQKRFLHIAIRKYDFVEKRARKARERKQEKRESGKKKNLSTVFENVLKIVQQKHRSIGAFVLCNQ